VDKLLGKVLGREVTSAAARGYKRPISPRMMIRQAVEEPSYDLKWKRFYGSPFKNYTLTIPVNQVENYNKTDVIPKE
jgi:hypothetical protein